MRWFRWLITAETFRKRLENVEKDREELAHDVARLSRTIDELELDMSALYDKTKAALARISTRERRAKADDPIPQDNGGPASVDDLNRLIQDGKLDLSRY